MKRTDLERRTPLRRSTNLEQRTPLVKEPARSFTKRRAVSPASEPQRTRVRGTVCRECGSDEVTPAHVVDRSIGGCDSPLCVVPLCWRCHRAYDEHRLDILALLDWEEQAHAVAHIGLIGALERTTNINWIPESEARSES